MINISLQAIREIQGYLSSSSAVTGLVPKNSIKVGWPRTMDSFPCIIITQVAGSDTGYLGYNTAIAGSKLRREEPVIGIDIYSRDSMRDVLSIGDKIIPVLISGACRKDSDYDDYIDEVGAYRRLLTFSFNKLRED